MKYNINEQWLLDGDCSICRRKNYCNKPCKRANIKSNRDLMYTITKTALKILSDQYNHHK